MSRILTFSRTFPAYHPRKGEPTYFVEKIWKSLYKLDLVSEELDICINNCFEKGLKVAKYNDINSKHHTIRAGNRWKVGDKFSPRVWLYDGGRYVKGNKQITIAPDVEVKKIWEFEIEKDGDYTCILIDKKPFYEENRMLQTNIEGLTTLTKNDGLALKDFAEWFKSNKPFIGQIICWNENINY